MTEQPQVHSILVRVQRVTSEEAYVLVPITERILTTRADGTLGIDGDRFSAEAVRLSADQRVEWNAESIDVAPHPIQQPLPENRRAFNPAETAGPPTGR